MCFSSLSIAYATEEELEDASAFSGVAPAAVCERDINDEPSDVMLICVGVAVRLITC
jgi:hypothetical protein